MPRSRTQPDKGIRIADGVKVAAVICAVVGLVSIEDRLIAAPPQSAPQTPSPLPATEATRPSTGALPIAENAVPNAGSTLVLDAPMAEFHERTVQIRSGTPPVLSHDDEPAADADRDEDGHPPSF
jgi:hypothetical protein